MANCETTEELLALQRELNDVSDMFGWLCTHKYKIEYPIHPSVAPETRQYLELKSCQIQSQIEVAAEFIHVISIYSILDEAGFTPRNKWIPSNDLLEFQAWVHVRHTGAHTPNGRANVYYDKFDDFMKSPQEGQSMLKAMCDWDATSIRLHHTASYRFFNYVQELVKRAMEFCERSRYSSTSSIH